MTTAVIEADAFQLGGDRIRFADVAELYVVRRGFADSLGLAVFDAVTDLVKRITDTGFEFPVDIRTADGRSIRMNLDRSSQRSERERVAADYARTLRMIFERTLPFRLKPLQDSLEKDGFFSFDGYEFHRDGAIYRNGKCILNVRDPGVETVRTPRIIVLSARGSSVLFGKVYPVDWTRNGDCFFYMMQQTYGLALHKLRLIKP